MDNNAIIGEYVCSHCGETFQKTRPDEVAMEEFNQAFPNDNDPVIVCEDCYLEFMKWYKNKINR